MSDENISPGEFARQLAAQRDLVDKPCKFCGRMMFQVLKKREFCPGSESCKQKYKRKVAKEKAAEVAADQRKKGGAVMAKRQVFGNRNNHD